MSTSSSWMSLSVVLRRSVSFSPWKNSTLKFTLLCVSILSLSCVENPSEENHPLRLKTVSETLNPVNPICHELVEEAHELCDGLELPCLIVSCVVHCPLCQKLVLQDLDCHYHPATRLHVFISWCCRWFFCVEDERVVRDHTAYQQRFRFLNLASIKPVAVGLELF